MIRADRREKAISNHRRELYNSNSVLSPLRTTLVISTESRNWVDWLTDIDDVILKYSENGELPDNVTEEWIDT